MIHIPSCTFCQKDFEIPLGEFNAGRGKYCSRQCASSGRIRPLKERFLDKADQSAGPDACWPWQGTRLKLPYGFDYGVIALHGKSVKAHRIAYQLFYGDFDQKLFVLHSCDVPHCVNPRHLFLGTPMDNMQDKVRKKRHRYGENSHFAKITEGIAILILQELKKEQRKYGKYKRIAQMFNVNIRTVLLIDHGETWSHLAARQSV